MLHVACCMLHVACCMPSVACGMLPPGAHALEASSYARTHARAQRARADALVGMAVADEAVGRKASVALSRTVHRPQLPSHTLCTAAAPHPSLQSSAGLQLAQVAVNCNAAEKALLADLTEAHPDASYIDLLRLFKARRSVADGHSWRACCIVSASRCLRKSARSCRT